MITETTEKKGTRRFDARACEHSTHTQYYLNASVLPGETDADSVRELFVQAAEFLSAENIQPLQERIFGSLSHRDEILSLREGAYSRSGVDPAVPCSFVEGSPAEGGTFAGLQIWGIAPHKPGENTVSTTSLPDGSLGRIWKGEGFRLIHLPGVRAIEEEEDCVTCQAREMFANASARLQANGLTFQNTIRTWIYVARLLDWYGEFNRIRSAHFNGEGLRRENGSVVFPASTAIQGKSCDEECFMDVLALEDFSGGRVRSTPIVTTSRQNQASSYGSDFSRGMSIEIEGRQTVFVSGTASINARGETVNPRDAELQAVETLLNIAALLNDRGGSLMDICTATVYCRTRTAYEAYLQVLHLLGIPRFPSIGVLADICRPDLELEIEAVAVI